MPTKSPGDVLTSSLWNTYLRDNIDKLLSRGHRVLTVAQFTALTGLEGTKGSVPPDEAYVEVDSSAGVQWHFAYESGEATYKWRFLGGPALISEVATAESLPANATTTYQALATAGPSVPLPRAGDYDVAIGARILGANDGGGNGQNTRMSYDIGGTGAVDADAVEHIGGNGTPTITQARTRRKTGLTSVTLTSKYSHSGTLVAGGTFANRWMSVLPVRVRHDA